LLARCQLLGADVTEIPVQWRDVAGSTFSVGRHSAAVVRDLASIWMRTRAVDRPAGAGTPVLTPDWELVTAGVSTR
jgi:hypothetical protein